MGVNEPSANIYRFKRKDYQIIREAKKLDRNVLDGEVQVVAKVSRSFDKGCVRHLL